MNSPRDPFQHTSNAVWLKTLEVQAGAASVRALPAVIVFRWFEEQPGLAGNRKQALAIHCWAGQ
jgi:hypothetical protein